MRWILVTAAVLVVMVAPNALGGEAGSDKPASAVAPARATKSATYCPGVKAGIQWYRQQIAAYREKRWLGATSFLEKPRLCVRAREVAEQARKRLATERGAYQRWHDYHWNWPSWLPDKWQRIGACETGYGQRPGNWRHANSKFQGAFGFYHGSWDAFVPRADPKAGPYPSEAYLATPRQQYEVAQAIYRMYGLSGWGCRGA